MILNMSIYFVFFFFQAEDGIRDWSVTGVQTCALPISPNWRKRRRAPGRRSSIAPFASLLLHFCRQQNLYGGIKSVARTQGPSPVGEKWEKLANFFVGGLMAVFRNFKSFHVLNAVRLGTVPLLQRLAPFGL